MPTPSGVNYLLQSLQSSLIPQLSKDKNQKWTSSLMPLYLLSLHTHTPLVITHYFLEAAVWTESDAKLQIFVDFGAEFGRNMLHEVANWQFFCRRCQKVVEI